MVLGSVIVGWLLAWPVRRIVSRIADAPSSVIIQFVLTFTVWLVAERLGLSGVVTIVVFGLTMARGNVAQMAAHLRIPSFAIWETVTVVLNVLAFTLIGLQLRPILEPLSVAERWRYLGIAVAILAVAIVVRIAWVMVHHFGERLWGRIFAREVSTDIRKPLVIGWSGMRGIVSLAAALALPEPFPYRDFILLAAFVVVLGTLVIQGVTLGPLLGLLKFARDTTVERELGLARKAAMKAAMRELDGDESAAAERLRREYAEALDEAKRGGDPRDSTENAIRRRLVSASRSAIEELRGSGAIGDAAYRQAEEELDWLELSARPRGARE